MVFGGAGERTCSSLALPARSGTTTGRVGRPRRAPRSRSSMASGGAVVRTGSPWAAACSMGRAERPRAGDVAVGAVAALRIPFWLGTARLNALLAEPRHANRRGRDPELAVKAAFLALRLLARLRFPL